MRPLTAVGLRTVRALSLSQAQASTLRPQAPAFVPTVPHRNATVLAFPPLLASQRVLTSAMIKPLVRADPPMTLDRQPHAPPPQYPLYTYSELSPDATLHYLTDADEADALLAAVSLRGPLGVSLWCTWKHVQEVDLSVRCGMAPDIPQGYVYLFRVMSTAILTSLIRRTGEPSSPCPDS
jgi:hypothetical protein